MIQSKADYQYYLLADRIAMGKSSLSLRSKLIELLMPDYLWRYQKLLRKIEYRTNCKKGIFNKLILFVLNVRHYHLGTKLLINIYPNTCGPGLSIAHHGPIRINKGAKIGKNCRIHFSVSIATQAGKSADSAIIGDNVYIGPGVKIVSPCRIADNIAIGANAVVNKSFEESGVVIAGIPAKVVKTGIDTRKILIPATELIQRGILNISGQTSKQVFDKYFSQ